MNALTRMRQLAAVSLKEAPRVSGRIRVGGTGSNAYMGNWVDSDRPGTLYNSKGRGSALWIPGTHINWDTVTGEVLSCPAARACLNWKARNRPQAPPRIEQQQAEGEWETVAHPLTKKLRRPNPFYDGDTLLNQTSFSLDTNGNAYIVIEFSKGGDAAEFYWWPHNWVDIPPEYSDIIQSYILRNRLGKNMEIPAENVIHLKWGLDPEDWRFGMSPIAAASRGIYSLQMSNNYRANVLRNFGLIGKLVSPKQDSVSFNPADLKKVIDDRTQGDNVGSTLVLDFPVDMQYPTVTPQNMAIETMDDRPEADIHSLFGIPPQVTGSHVGRLSKTFANYGEARESAWEEAIMPENILLGCQFGYRALPLFSKGQDVETVLDTFRIGWDYRAVRPLQEDMDKKNTRELAAYEKDAITLGEFCRNTDRPEPRPEFVDLYFSEIKAIIAPAPVMEPVNGNGQEEPEDEPQKPSAGKSSWEARIEAELQELERLHAGSEFAGAGNGVHA